MIPDSVAGLRAVMADHDYVLSDGLAVSLFLDFANSSRCFSRKPVSARPRLRTLSRCLDSA